MRRLPATDSARSRASSAVAIATSLHLPASGARLNHMALNDVPPAGSLLEEEALRFIRDLIRIESVNTGDPDTIGDGETRAARYVQAALEDVGYETTFVES